MKIAYDPQVFSFQVYGGVSRYFCEIAARIATQPNAQVSIIAPLHVNAYLKNIPPGLVSGCHGLNARHLRLPQRGLSMLIGEGMLHAAAPDLVHETYYFPYRLGPRRARRVLTIYDMIHEKFSSNIARSDRAARYKALAAERADHVICISESTRRDAIEILGLAPEKTTVIYLGCDLMKPEQLTTENLRLPTREPYLLYVGLRGTYKNFLRFLEAYATSPQLRTGYQLICFGGGALCADELKAIHAFGLATGQVIQLAGDDQLLAQLYEHASAFVYPSLYEGFGIPPLEAMAHDCPVVCSNTSSIPEVVGDAGEYFEPNSIESMRTAMERVVGSDSHRKELIEKGRVRLKSFSWDRCALETLDVYQKLL